MKSENKKKNWPAKCPIPIKNWTKIQKTYHLTPKELQVCIAICRGCNNKEIAQKMGIQEGTLETHINKIYIKISVNSKILLLLKLLET